MPRARGIEQGDQRDRGGPGRDLAELREQEVTEPLAVEWYGIVQPPWITDPLKDTLDGGQVAWGLSEIPSLIVLIVIAVQWARSDDREATRMDRQADRDDDAELRAYNDRLAALARRDDRAP